MIDQRLEIVRAGGGGRARRHGSSDRGAAEATPVVRDHAESCGRERTFLMCPAAAVASRGVKKHNGDPTPAAVAIGETNVAEFREAFAHLWGRHLRHHRKDAREQYQTLG